MRRVRILEYERAVRFVDGRLVDVLGAGRHWIRQRRTTLVKVDVRPRFVVVPGQETLTADGVTVKATVALRYEVTDPARTLTSAVSFMGDLYVVVQLALRALVATLGVEELVAQRTGLGDAIRDAVAPPAEALGVRVLEAGLRDVMFPGEVKRVLGAVVQARIEGQAQLERVRAESAALRSLANAAKLLDGNPGLAQLRFLQVAAEQPGNTFVIGVPGMPVLPAS